MIKKIILSSAILMIWGSSAAGSSQPLAAEDPCLLPSVICEGEPQNIILKNQEIYGYSSRVSETDGDPFTTSNGSRVSEGIIANNCYRFGQRLRVGYGSDKKGYYTEFEVIDRMNKRYGCNDWDIWFEDIGKARRWGVQILSIELL